MVDNVTKNNGNEFDFESIKTYPVKNVKGLMLGASIQKSKSSGNEQFALKKVGSDDSGFPRGQAKNFWIPRESLPALIEYLKECLADKK